MLRPVKCDGCHKPIAPREQKQAVIVRDDEGRIVKAYHKHHARRAKAQAREGGAVPGLVYHEWRPGAYDVERVTSDDEEADNSQEDALRVHQERLAADREEEDVPEQWDDWRDPETVSLDDLVERVEEEVESVKDR